MRLATSIDITFSEFWEMTPYELNLKASDYKEKKKEDYKEKISIAYQNAMWTIQWLGKKSQQPRPLQEILDNLYKKENKIMTDDEMLSQVKFLNNLFGGEEIVNPC